MMSCKHASHLISEGCDRRLRLQERLSLQLHLWMCVNCRRFVQQLKALRAALHLAGRTGQWPGAKPMPAASRARIRETLYQATRQGKGRE
jgi:hypothetical protein